MHPSITATHNLLHADLYRQAGFELTQYSAEAESADYNACNYQLSHFRIIFRNAKTTPTKTGQFVTVWKRSPAGPIAPFDIDDDFDFLIIASQTAQSTGHFIFPKKALLEQGIISGQSKEGKRGIRVYPPGETVTNKTAQKTQNRQRHFFLNLLDAEPVVLARINELLHL